MSEARRLRVLQQHLHPTADDGDGLDAQPRVSAIPAAGATGAKRRAVIVAGARTPFVKAFGDAIDLDSAGLGVVAVGGLLAKTKLDPNLIDDIIWGNVVLSTGAPNVAREIAIDLNLPAHVPGVTVSRACLSGMEAIVRAVQAIECGDADVIIAGGSDSTSNGELPLPRRLTHALGRFQYGRNKGLPGVRKMLREAGPVSGWLPTPPQIAERSTGRKMGYHADLMAQLNHVSRQEQDKFAMASHAKAAAAQRKGYLAEEIVPLHLAKGKVVDKDEFIRAKQDPAKLARLRPAFRKPDDNGTVTAASSSPLTDGGSAVLVMSEDKARELGYPVDISIRSAHTTAIDPYPQLLLAPAVAIPKVLSRAGLTIDDIDIVEMHEAFAAQCLATLRCLESSEFAAERTCSDTPVGKVPLSKINPNGSSIAIGHPFAATGGRLVMAAANELRRSNKRYALLSVCAAGGMGGAAVIERNPDA